VQLFSFDSLRRQFGHRYSGVKTFGGRVKSKQSANASVSASSLNIDYGFNTITAPDESLGTVSKNVLGARNASSACGSMNHKVVTIDNTTRTRIVVNFVGVSLMFAIFFSSLDAVDDILVDCIRFH
jgi:hypothetical protein